MVKKIIYASLVSLFVLSCGKSTTEEPEIVPEEVNVKKVLIIGIDGCMPVGINAANTPSLDALMANGTYSLEARNTGITSSGPGWSSMLTGVWDDKHGVVDNSFLGSKFNRYPHVFKRIEEYNASYRTVSVSQWHPINDKIVNGDADAIRNSEDTSVDTKNKAVAELGVEDLTALFVHFDDVDHAGHGTGFSIANPNYIQAIERVDTEIGAVMAAVKARANYEKEDWIIILSTDHGGKGRSHGGNSEEERIIFMIASGDSVPNKEITKTTTETVVPPVDNCLSSATELHFENDGLVKIPNNAIYNFGENQDFSIECRVRTKDPSDVCIVGKKDWNNGTLPGYVFSFKPSTQKFKVNVGDGTNRVDVETAVISDNEWHTLSATFDRDGMLRVYIDGTLSNSASMSAIGDIDNAFPLTIGADGNSAYKYNGFISEVRVFNSLLSVEEIDSWKCKVLDNTHPKFSALQGEWKLTEGTGTAITDSSLGKTNGVLTGGSWEDATQSKTVTISNFDNTPRTVDVVKTVLNHLCIPVQGAWGLEGNSLIDSDCSN